MTGKRSSGDKEGWKRGAMGIDGHESPGLKTVKDYGSRGISPGSFGEPMKHGNEMLGADLTTWAPYKIREGKNTNRAKGKDYGTKSPEADEPKGKFASKGIGKYMVK